MIIGITGTNGSGKDTAADLLVERGFKRYSCSDIIRDEATRRGISHDRENLILLGNELRAHYGEGYLGEQIGKQITEEGIANAVVVSIRHPAEVEGLKANASDHFKLFFVDAPIEVRYKRVIGDRKSDKDNVDFETFREQEQREMQGTGHQQQLKKVFDICNGTIDNSGDLHDLKRNLTKALRWSRFEKIRDPWDVYFMKIAKQVARRSTCDRLHVGAVLVKDKTILSTGYNGSIRGMPHCDDIGHMMVDGHCVATIHGETNAIIQAAKNGVNIDGADLYITFSPCWICFKAIINAGIKKVFYESFYRDARIEKVAQELGIQFKQVEVKD